MDLRMSYIYICIIQTSEYLIEALSFKIFEDI